MLELVPRERILRHSLHYLSISGAAKSTAAVAAAASSTSPTHISFYSVFIRVHHMFFKN